MKVGDHIKLIHDRSLDIWSILDTKWINPECKWISIIQVADGRHDFVGFRVVAAYLDLVDEHIRLQVILHGGLQKLRRALGAVDDVEVDASRVKRIMLFQSLLMSKLLYGSGAWQPMHIQTQRSWHSKLMHLYASIAPSVICAEGVSTLDILADVSLACPQLVLAVQRLRLFSRVMRSEMTDLLAVLQAQAPGEGWLDSVCQDIVHMSRLLPIPEVVEAATNGCSRTLAQYAFAHPRFFLALSKRAMQAYQCYLRIWRDFRKFQSDFDHDASQFGVTWHDSFVPRTHAADFICDFCNASFHTFHGLCTHVWKQHQISTVAQSYAQGATCRACLKRYDGRSALINHLRYFRTGCLLKLIATTAPLSPEEIRKYSTKTVSKFSKSVTLSARLAIDVQLSAYLARFFPGHGNVVPICHT